MKATEVCDKGKRAEEENKNGDEGHSEVEQYIWREQTDEAVRAARTKRNKFRQYL